LDIGCGRIGSNTMPALNYFRQFLAAIVGLVTVVL
jgi:hypothetical protein